MSDPTTAADARRTEMSGFDFISDAGGFTGVVYWGTGSLPYTAALDGEQLLRADGKVRQFKTADAARVALAKTGGAS